MGSKWSWIGCGAALALLGACGDDAKRPIGSTCGRDEDCESGICGGNECLDPQADEDGDGLINRIEAGLDTDPVVADSDKDGVADGLEVGDAVNSPRDTDSDGRIDAVESATADCDGDQQVDQADASDGLAADGSCPGSVVVSPCSALCTRAGQLACGDTTGCLSDCSGVFTDMTSDCRAKFATAGKCVAEASGADCATEGAPTWQLFVPETTCASEIDAVGPCLTPFVCDDPIVLALDQAREETLGQSDHRAYSVALAADTAYEITVRVAGADDDPSVVVFPAGTARCDWMQDPIGAPAPLALSDNDAGFDEAIQLGAGAARTIEILLVNQREGGDTRCTIDVHELGI